MMRKRDVLELARIMSELRPPNPPGSQPMMAWERARRRMLNNIIPGNYDALWQEHCPLHDRKIADVT